MRSVAKMLGMMAILLPVAFGQRAPAGQTSAVWRAEAKDLAEKATKYLIKKVAGDAEAVAGARLVNEWLLKDEQLDTVGKILQKKFKTERPEPKKMKVHQENVIKAIDSYDVQKLKRLLKNPKPEELPCPPFWWCN